MHRPKPTREDRLAKKRRWKEARANYIRVNAAKAIERDRGLCVICYFQDKKERKAAQVHHVYGRARSMNEIWREHYTSLMNVCREHHPPPIQVKGASRKLGWVEEILRKANEEPINRRFRG